MTTNATAPLAHRGASQQAADTGLIDFPTFVLVLQRWKETYDPAVVLESVWRRKAGARAKVGVDVIKEVLTELVSKWFHCISCVYSHVHVLAKAVAGRPCGRAHHFANLARRHEARSAAVYASNHMLGVFDSKCT